MNTICPKCGSSFEPTPSQIKARKRTCKPCVAAYFREWVKNNKKKIVAYNKAHKEESRNRARNYRTRNREAIAERQRYLRSANPEIYKARTKLDNCIQTGKIKRPGVCECCGATCPVEGHHKDYGRPLDVQWLCNSCHDSIHRGGD